MSYYILEDGYLLRGYKKLPFGITHPDLFSTDFFDREQYELVLDCDGNTDIVKENLSQKQSELLKRLLELKFIKECKKGTKLTKRQEYILYPATYKQLVQWSITERCNYLCKHCFLSAPDYKGEDLSLEKCIKVLDELCECGIHCIGITGGEPLVHKDFFALLKEIKNRGMVLESIYTNCALVNEELLDELERLEIKPGFNISFDGVGKHDWLRGITGAEQKTIEAIKLLKSRDYHIGVAMSLHKDNIPTLRETVNLLAKLGCDHLKVNSMDNMGNWLNESENLISEEEVYDYLIDYIPKYFEDGMPISMQIGIVCDYDKKDKRTMIPAEYGTGDESVANRPSCGVVKKGLYIGANGKVLPCMPFSGHPLEKEFDSLFDKPLKDIINDSKYTTYFNATCGDCISHNEKCKDCEYKWICRAGCRAAACDRYKTDYYGIDEKNCLFFKGGYYDRVLKILKEIEED